ncbi:MAG TPA: hypothetical protein VFW19_12420 [Allosphingosinicella sp.]|nr:hypothetical protein [Allosphingosinicella sp.]
MTEAQRTDPRTGSVLTLSSAGLAVTHPDGRHVFIAAPPGYSLSHFEAGITVVGRGEAQHDGWWDWHFEPDLEAGVFRRLGPAY